MSSIAGRHPSEEQLLRFADGELTAGESGTVRSHLEACWQCRSELESIEKAIARCVVYRKAVLDELLPPPPRAWTDIRDRFAEVDSAAEQHSWMRRFASSLGLNSPRRWAAVAAMIALVFTVQKRLQEAPSVQAAALLRKAVVAASLRNDTPRRLQIRTRTKRIVRPAKAAPSQETAALKTRFTSANYDWEAPLTAQAFEHWRDQVADKQDEVAEAGGVYRIKTTAGSGDLTEATLALRTGDLQPVEGVFRFRDDELIQITEAPEEPALITDRTVRPGAPTAPAVAPVDTPQAIREATPVDELRVAAVLQRLGADLGESIEIIREGAQIRVQGVGVDPARRKQIVDALGEANVSLRFNEAASIHRPPQRAGQIAVGMAGSGFQEKIEETLGGRPQAERLAGSILDQTEEAMARAYALKRLAERFPANVEAGFSADDRTLLRNMLTEHAAAFQRNAGGIAGQMEPVLAGLGAAPPPASGGLPPAWQTATEELFQTARRVEHLLGVLFGGAPADVTTGQLPNELARALSELRTKTELYRQIVGQ